MNFRRLEYFMVLGQTGTLRRASEILRVSPPALSKAMKVLEEELDLQLWVKTGRGMTLSDAGKQLLRKVPMMIEEWENLRESLSRKDSAPRQVKIGTFEVFSTYFLSFLKQMPWDSPLELHELLPGEVEKFLLQGELDYGITYMPVPTPDLDFVKISTIEMGVYTRKGSFEGIPQTELPFVVPVTPLHSIPTRIRGLDGWPDTAYRRKILHRVTLMESALELCRQGCVAGYFPVFIAREHNLRVRPELALERRPSPYPGRTCSADVYIVKRKATDEDRVVKRLAQAIRFICGTLKTSNSRSKLLPGAKARNSNVSDLKHRKDTHPKPASRGKPIRVESNS